MNYDIPKCPITRTRDVRYESIYPDYDPIYIERTLNAFDINQQIINSESYIAYTGRITHTPYGEHIGPTRSIAESIPAEFCTESFVPSFVNLDPMRDATDSLCLTDIQIESQVDSSPIMHDYNYIKTTNTPVDDMCVETRDDDAEKRSDEYVIDIVEIECEDTPTNIDNVDISRVTLTRGSNNVFSEYENQDYWKVIDECPNYWDYYEDVTSDNDNDLNKDYTEKDLEYDSDLTHSSMPELIDVDSDDE